MFSTGHLMWIAISCAIIICILIYCKIKSPDFIKFLKVCFAFGLLSEFIKIFSVANILPIVEPMIEGDSITYQVAGTYSPYLENSHLPLELCSLQIVFYAVAIWTHNPERRKVFTSLIFVTGIIGGTLGITMAYIASEYDSVMGYFSAVRVWQFFLYHAMVVAVGIYAGFGKNSTVEFKHLKPVVTIIISFDVISLYLNSIFSEPVYTGTKPIGLMYRVNFFSSYVNPIGLVLTEKWQWIAYLLVRFTIAFLLILVLFQLQKKCHKQA